MKHRAPRKLSKRHSRKVFTKKAKHHKYNAPKVVTRGGIRF